MKLPQLLSIVVLLIAQIPRSAVALDAKQIFEKTALSTVLIQDVDCFGSGIVLTDKGLILTNFHVVAAQISLRVSLKVKKGGKIILTDIDNVKVVKVHPQYDLALLQITPPPDASLIPAEMIPKEVPLSPGAKCYAIGNPGGPDGKALDLSITEGLVSAAARNVEGLDYVQVSAPLNHGNSGGPICDDMGRVFGIATWKMDDTEGIAFAIPSQKLALADFIEPTQRTEDKRLMQAAEEAAQRAFEISRQTTGREREYYLAVSGYCYHMMIQASPNRPDPLYNYGLTLSDLGKDENAKKYFEAALRLDPVHASACHMLGATLFKEDPTNMSKATALWLRGLDDDDDPVGVCLCADDMAVAMSKQNKLAPAAYMLQWSESLAKAVTFSRPNRTSLWKTLQVSLSVEELSTIRRKGAAFSKAEFDAIVAGKSLSSVVGLTKDVATPIDMVPGGVAKSRPTAATPPATQEVAAQTPSKVKPPRINTSALESIVKEAAGKFAGSVTAIPNEGLELPLPGKPTHPTLAYAGHLLVLRFPDLGKLGIFNLASAKFEKFLDCPDKDALFATGGRSLLVYSPSTNAIDMYELDSYKLVKSVSNPLPDRIRFLAMGLLNGERAFVLSKSTDQKNQSNFYSPALLTIPEFQAVPLVPVNVGGLPVINSDFQSEEFRGAMDEDGLMCVVCLMHNYASTAEYVIRSDGTAGLFFPGFLSGRLEIAKNGGYIIGRDGMLRFHEKSGVIKPPYKSYSTPPLTAVAGLAGYVEYWPNPNRGENKGSALFSGFRIRGLPLSNLIEEIPSNREVDPEMNRGGQSDSSPVALGSAYSGRIALVDPGERKIFLYKMQRTSSRHFVSIGVPGRQFQRELSIPSGSSVTIESGPSGLRYESDTTSLVWDVPTDMKSDQEIQVIMMCKTPEGKQEYLTEKIRIE